MFAVGWVFEIRADFCAKVLLNWTANAANRYSGDTAPPAMLAAVGRAA